MRGRDTLPFREGPRGLRPTLACGERRTVADTMPMKTTLCLLTGLLTLAQPPAPVPVASSRPAPPQPAPPQPAAPQPARPPSGEWQILPRVVAAQELVYRGLYSEQTLGTIQ